MASKQSSAPETGRETTPKQFPNVVPTYGDAVNSGHLTEALMQVQQTIGELKSDVRHLKEASDKQTVKLDSISHRMYAAGVLLTVILATGGFILNKIWDNLVTLLIRLPTPPVPPT